MGWMRLLNADMKDASSGRNAPRTAGAGVARAALPLEIAIFLLALSGCSLLPGGGSKPEPAASPASPPSSGDEMKLTLRAADRLNTSGDAAPNALVVRVYQLGSDSAIRGASLAQLWDREEELLGPDLIEMEEHILDPGQQIPLKVDLKRNARFLAIAGGFYKADAACWMWVAPLAELKGKQEATFGEDCVAVESK